MPFSNEWDDRYSDNKHLSIWPWSDLVSYVNRYARPDRAGYRVLELGCGAGANIMFFRSLGVEYYAVDGSPYAVDMLHKKYPELADRIVCADFTRELPFNGKFDLVVDRSSLTHNSTSDIEKCLRSVYLKLVDEGAFIGIDWFSTVHPGHNDGEETDDPHTRKGYRSKYFVNVGNVHFSDKTHILELFKEFELAVLEHKIIERYIPETEIIFASWNFVAKKNKA